MEKKFSIEPLEKNELGKLRGGFTSSSSRQLENSLRGSVTVSVTGNCSCGCSTTELQR